MADNPFDLMNILTNAQQIQAAGAGGYGSSSRGAGRNILMFLGALAPALAGVRQKGLIPAAMEAAGGYARLKNLQDYNRYLLAENAAKTAASEQAYGTLDPRLKGLGRADSSVVDKVIQGLGNVDYGNAVTTLHQGQYPESYGLSPAAQVQQIASDMLKREGEIADSGATTSRLLNFLNQAQRESGVAGGTPLELDPSVGAGVSGSAPPVYQPGKPMAAGASYDSIEAPTVNPYFRGALDLPSITKMIEQGLGDTQEVGKQRLKGSEQQETARHNKASEASAARQAAAAMLRAQKYQPGGGRGSQNPYTIPNAQQNYIQGQISAIDQELKSLGLIGKYGKLNIPEAKTDGWFGWGNSSPAEVAKIDRAKQLLQTKQQLQQMIGLPSNAGSAPFKNQALSNLKSPAQWKSGKK